MARCACIKIIDWFPQKFWLKSLWHIFDPKYLGRPTLVASATLNLTKHWTIYTSLMNYGIELLEMMGKCSIAFAHAKQPPVGWNTIFSQHWLLRG